MDFYASFKISFRFGAMMVTTNVNEWLRNAIKDKSDIFQAFPRCHSKNHKVSREQKISIKI